ncbi:MAG: cyclase family protein [Proteobacteria bacterium]|nr:cyclase family protein [Pseudomonadota bacterium]
MLPHKKIHDISVMLGEESIDYPGDTPYSRKQLSAIAEGGMYDLSSLELSAHSGTHIDAPAHFMARGRTIDRYEIGDFILPALVVDIDDPDAVRPEAVAGLALQTGEALLFRTQNSASGTCRKGVFSECYVHLSPEAARACVAKRASLVGLDYVTIEPYGNEAFEAHRTLLQAGVLILEGINLDHVPAGRYTLVCLPLKMKNAEASPVRAVLLEWTDAAQACNHSAGKSRI